MYCINCGKNNPEGSKFCQHCGIKLGSKQHASENVSKSEASHKNEESINSETSPYPYVISTWKLIILSITTFGLYEIYWFYKQWKSFKADRGLKGNAWLHAIFAAIASYYLFKEVARAIKEMDKSRRLQAGWLAIAFFILISLWKLPDNYWWLSMLSFWPLIPVQNAINYYWEKKYGNKIVESNFGTSNSIWAIIGGIILVLALYGTFDTSTEYAEQSNNTTNSTVTTSSENQASLEATYRKNFMDNCVGEGATYSLCSCVLEYLRTNYSFSERLKMDEEYSRTEQLPQATYDAIDACANQ